MGQILYVAWYDNGLDYEDHHIEFLGVYTSQKKASKVAASFAAQKREEYLSNRAMGLVETVTLNKTPQYLTKGQIITTEEVGK